MGTANLLAAIEKLPIVDRLRLAEAILHSVVREQSQAAVDEADVEMAEAARLLLEDYRQDAELTAFTALDNQAFYEEGARSG